MSNPNRITQVAAELAHNLRELQADSVVNNAGFIERKIREALDGRPEVKPLLLERPLVGFDIESTGVDVALDRIIQLAVRRIEPPDLFCAEETVREKEWLLNPGCLIPPDSTRIHGITDAMVKDCPLFSDVAEEIHEWFHGADVTGYNVVNMDVPMLWEHFHRVDMEWEIERVKIVDASGIFQRKVPRNLSAAVKRYCGREHDKAHNAMADVIAALDVLQGQRARYADLAAMNVAGLAEFSTSEEYQGQPAKRLDLAGMVIEDCAGVARYTHKKVRGVAVYDDPGYAGWMLQQHWIPSHTKRVLVQLLQEMDAAEDRSSCV